MYLRTDQARREFDPTNPTKGLLIFANFVTNWAQGVELVPDERELAASQAARVQDQQEQDAATTQAVSGYAIGQSLLDEKHVQTQHFVAFHQGAPMVVNPIPSNATPLGQPHSNASSAVASNAMPVASNASSRTITVATTRTIVLSPSDMLKQKTQSLQFALSPMNAPGPLDTTFEPTQRYD